MCNIIHFYDKQRQQAMSFSNFEFQKEDGNIFIYFTVIIEYYFIMVKRKFECAIENYVDFSENLQKMYDSSVNKFSFVAMLDGQLVITFETVGYGHINVTIKINEGMPNILLRFEYETDQSFLPELMREISTMIDSSM
jgi:hypothetical protein